MTPLASLRENFLLDFWAFSIADEIERADLRTAAAGLLLPEGRRTSTSMAKREAVSSPVRSSAESPRSAARTA